MKVIFLGNYVKKHKLLIFYVFLYQPKNNKKILFFYVEIRF
ncbi:hypothetical protein PSOL_06110 [Candidatus Phytoplasma solani]